MKVLLIHDYDVPFGGAELGALTLREGLRQRGHDARLLTSSARPAAAERTADYECLGTLGAARTLLQTANPFAYGALKQTIAAFAPDVVHVRMFLTQLSPLILPCLRDTPSLYHAVWYRAICPTGSKLLPDRSPCTERAGWACKQNRCLPWQDLAPLALQMAMLRRFRGVFRRVVANSHAVASSLSADGIAPVEVIWNGVPMCEPRPPLTGPPRIGYAGRLVREKGVDVLIRAFAQVVARIPEARLIVIGDGPARAALKQEIADLGISHQVMMTGQLTRAEAEVILRSAWVQVVPSIWPEPFGFVAAEAMMRGTAVVASRAGGLAEIVKNEVTGLLIPAGEEPALTHALLALLGDCARAERLGAAGRTFAIAHLRQDQWIDRFVEIYNELREPTG